MALGRCIPGVLLLQTQGQRYQLHPVVRDYASLCLAHAAPAQETAITRFLAHAIRFLERDGQECASIEHEVVVLQTALDLAWKSQRHQEAFRLTEALTAHWIAQHQWEQAQRYFSTALTVARQQRKPPHHAIHCLLGLGRCALARHERTSMLSFYQEAVVYAREPGTDKELLVIALLKLGAVSLQLAHHYVQVHYAQAAKATCIEALDVLHHLPPPSRLSPALQASLPLLYEMLGTVALEEEGTLVALDIVQHLLGIFRLF